MKTLLFNKNLLLGGLLTIMIAAITAQGAGWPYAGHETCRMAKCPCCAAQAPSSPARPGACCREQPEPVAHCCGKGMLQPPQPHPANLFLRASTIPCTCHLHSEDLPASLPPSSLRVDKEISPKVLYGLMFSSLQAESPFPGMHLKFRQTASGPPACIQHCVWRC